MIYFDNAATGGRKPACVTGAVHAAVDGLCANPGRGGHAAALALAERVYECRDLLAAFFGAADASRVIFTKNCTEALNAAIFGLANALKGKPHFITTALEHNSVLRPLFCLERAGKISLTVLLLQKGKILPEQFAEALRDDTAAAVFTLASNVTGAGIDPAAVRALLPERVYLLCDGAQACGHIPVNMRDMDALCVAGHKGMCGIQGAGALLLSERIPLAPLLYGGTGSESANPDMPDFLPDRLEAGTLSCPAIFSLAEGTLFVKAHMREHRKHLLALTRRLCEELSKIDGVKLYAAPNACGIVSFTAPLSSEQLAQRLSDEYGICVRGGLHCAPLCHEGLGTAEHGAVRASLSYHNTEKEAERFVQAVREILKG